MLRWRAFRDRLRNTALDVGNSTGRIDAAVEERLLGETTRALRDRVSSGIKEVVRELGLHRQLAAGAQPGWQWVWLTVGTGDVCSPCDDRHGREQTLDEWNAEGLPGGARVCLGGDRCRCSLVPIRPAGAESEAAAEVEWLEAAE